MRWLALAAAVHACVAFGDATPVGLPSELLFAGLSDGQWRLYVGAGEGVRVVRTSSEPRTPAYAMQLGRIAYVSDAGALRELDLRTGVEATVLEPTKDAAYTQPVYRPGGDELYVVVLHQGASVDTDLARIDRLSRKAVIVSRQRSAQFEPTFTRDGAQLVYSNVTCASECARIIQEIWAMEVVGGVARQLTLLNGVSRQANVDAMGRIVFSSNANGYQRVWRLNEDAAAISLTHDQAVDESPVAASMGDIFFIRRSADGSRIMRLDAHGAVHAVDVGRAFDDVRDLRVGS